MTMVTLTLKLFFYFQILKRIHQVCKSVYIYSPPKCFQELMYSGPLDPGPTFIHVLLWCLKIALISAFVFRVLKGMIAKVYEARGIASLTFKVRICGTG